MRIVLLGPPGAGKGTQAVLLTEQYSIPHISTGHILRDAVASNSELGNKVQAYLDAGELVPDALVIDIIKLRLIADDCKSGFLLDGFPRTVEQARALDAMLVEINSPLTAVIDMQVPESFLIERIKKRSEQSGRSDDSVEVLAKRLKVYNELTAPVSKHYAADNRLKTLDGLGTVEEVQQRLFALLN